MLPKKFYIPIGILILVICAIGFLSLRSDTPTEPIMIYKVVEPAEQSETQTATATRATAENGQFHAEQPPPSTAQVSQNRPTEGNTEASETIAFGGDIAAETPRLSKEEFEEKFKEELAEQRYDIAVAEYFKDFQEYHKKLQALNEEFNLLHAEADELRPYTNVDPETLGREKALEIRNAMLDNIEKRRELRKKKEALKAQSPIAPTPPASMERSNN